jgi:hypothetical protein
MTTGFKDHIQEINPIKVTRLSYQMKNSDLHPKLNNSEKSLNFIMRSSDCQEYQSSIQTP